MNALRAARVAHTLRPNLHAVVRVRLCSGVAAKPRVAFVGIGPMGSELCKRIARAGFPTRVVDKDDSLASAFGKLGGMEVAHSIEAAVVGAKFIVTSLPTSAFVTNVSDELKHFQFAPGTLWLDCSSGLPSATKALHAQLAERGVSLVDCAVSGGPAGARDGKLTVSVGGDEDSVAKLRPLIETFASTIIHIGGVGTGHAVKAVNNMLLASNLWIAGEALATLKKAGVSLDLAVEAINKSTGASFVTKQRVVEHILPRQFDFGFPLAQMLKDAKIALDIMHENDVHAPALHVVHDWVEKACVHLPASADHVEVVKLIEQMNHVVLESDSHPSSKE